MKLTTGFSCSSLIRPQPKYFTKLFIRAVSRECWVIWNTNFGVNPVFVLSAFFVPFFFMFFPCFLRFIHFILHIKWIKRRKHERTHKKTNTKKKHTKHAHTPPHTRKPLSKHTCGISPVTAGEYLQYLYSIFKEYCANPPRESSYTHPRTGQTFSQILPGSAFSSNG